MTSSFTSTFSSFSSEDDTHQYLPLGDSVLVSWIRSIGQTARGYGVEPEEIMQKAGINVSLLSVPEARFPAMYIRAFWNLMINEVGDPLFGLKCGAEMQASALHGLGLAIITSHSLAQVLEFMAIYGKVISSTMDLSLSHDKESTMLRLRTLRGNEIHHSATLALLAFIARQANSLAQRIVKPKLVQLSYDGWTTEELARLEAHFACPVQINSKNESGICYGYEDVVEPYACANAILRDANERLVKNYLYQVHRNSYTIRVEEEIHKLLEADEPLKITVVAKSLNLSPRTLQRRLELEHTSFADILERYRKQIAHDALVHTEKTITQIAYAVGFSDVSNFSRKCYSWFGSSPAMYRKRLRQVQR